MRIALIQEAELEFLASAHYYESREPGLGVRFEQEVDKVLSKIAADPTRPPLHRNCYRRVNLSALIWVTSVAGNRVVRSNCVPNPEIGYEAFSRVFFV